MTQKIRILPEDLCNKIAAGEVVERPAAVVKELMENSLDAGAGEVTVEVEAGGKRLIRITDDGCGMSQEDLLLCLERHATSKITSAEDLAAPGTLGFRGEALPSIAAVSRLTLRSRAVDAEAGWELYAEGGAVRRVEALGMPPGTLVEVRDLFFNMPARRKFLRQEATELGHLGEAVGRLALAHPRVQFRLRHQDRSLLDLYRHACLEERAAAFFGRALAPELVPVEAADGDLRISGLVGRPSAHRSTTQGIYLYVNRRYVRDRVFQHALLEGYRHLLPRGRFPVAVLFLDLDPRRVDVNVHPTKHEVRFFDQRRVHDFVAAAVRETFRPAPEPAHRPFDPTATGTAQTAVPSPVANPLAETGRDRVERIGESLERYASRVPPPAIPQREEAASGGFPAPALRPQGEDRLFAQAGIVGQYAGNYILVEVGDDLVMVDQHAAHERIGFERLRRQYREGEIERQRLLFPLVLEFAPVAATAVADRVDELQRLGFELEPFGGGSFALKAVPALLQDADAETLLRDVAAELAELGTAARIEAEAERLLVEMACHGVVRSGQALSRPEMAALLADLEAVDFGSHCPHGRPVLHRWSRGEIERLFQRRK